MKYEILDTLIPTHNPVEDERINQKCGKPAISNYRVLILSYIYNMSITI